MGGMRQLRSSLFVALATLALSAVAAEPAMPQEWCAPAWPVESIVAARAGTMVLQGPQGPQTISIAAVQNLLEVHRKMEQVSGLKRQLLLAPRADPNAIAHPVAGTICVSSGLLAIIGTDRDMAAALLGHEFAHHLKRHDIQRVQARDRIVANAVQKAQQVYRRTGSTSTAIEEGRNAVATVTFGFKREQEVEADRIGTRLAADAGYSPNGTIALADALLRDRGERPTGLFDTHPSFGDRRGRVRPVVTDESFNQRARELCVDQDWSACKDLVDEWLGVLPESGRAWYRRGQLLQKMNAARSQEAFENAVACDSDLGDAWYEVCTGLYRRGQKIESVNCAQWLPAELHQRYVRATGQNVVISAGNPHGGVNLAMGRDAHGGKLISNDAGVLRSPGVAAVPVPPAWRPLRYRSEICGR